MVIGEDGIMAQSGHWRESDGFVLTQDEAHQIWADEAYRILAGVARTYHAVITYRKLAEEIQKATGVFTSVLFHHWIGDVLRRVVHEAHRRGDPPLTALVVHTTDGKVGEGYKAVLEVAGEPPVENDLEREYHAASARLECYRRFCATLPPGGGVPALAPRLQESIVRRRSRAGGAPPRTCPTCFIQLPATGICDTCK